MINFRKDIQFNNTGIAYLTMLESAKDLYDTNPELAGEYALSVLELILSGEYSSDNYVIKAMLNPFKFMADKNIKKLEVRKEK